MKENKLKLNNGVSIGTGEKTFIIAEIGQNHQGSVEVAKQLIAVAKDCGVGCVKFQKTCINEKFNKAALEKLYMTENSWGKTYGEHKKYLEFSDKEFIELQSFANELGIIFTASAMDLVSLDFLVNIGVPFIKIGSGDANNFLLVEKAAQSGIPLIISTGMQDFNTVEDIYNLVSRYHKNFCFLHCLSSYPSPYNEINLNVINLYKEKFPDINIGYSGHELGIHITTAAVAMGAKIIERHITLDKNLKGSDHKCSLEPPELKELVHNIRTLEEAMGLPIKQLQHSEMECYLKLGKTIVFTKYLRAGHKLEAKDLNIKVAEPKGIDGSMLGAVIGKTLKQDVYEDQSLLPEYI